ncbi:hypothetical protein HDV06_002275 [Boothiomyces sp. JEL0866]|nr:hypothetical protein HDV06_002275 [Boothiomyces sp. JEL0866]
MWSLLLFFSAVSAQLGPGEVTISQITYQGDGCPQGSVEAIISADATVFTLLYSSFVASSGPGVAVSENIQQCSVIVDLNHAHGYTYTTLSLDHRGYVSVPAGLNAELSTTHFFKAKPNNPNFHTVFPGPYDNDYLVSTDNGVKERSQCGKKSRAIVNSSLRLYGGDTTTLAGYISGDSLDGNVGKTVKQSFHLDWKTC